MQASLSFETNAIIFNISLHEDPLAEVGYNFPRHKPSFCPAHSQFHVDGSPLNPLNPLNPFESTESPYTALASAWRFCCVAGNNDKSTLSVHLASKNENRSLVLHTTFLQ